MNVPRKYGTLTFILCLVVSVTHEVRRAFFI